MLVVAHRSIHTYARTRNRSAWASIPPDREKVWRHCAYGQRTRRTALPVAPTAPRRVPGHCYHAGINRIGLRVRVLACACKVTTSSNVIHRPEWMCTRKNLAIPEWLMLKNAIANRTISHFGARIVSMKQRLSMTTCTAQKSFCESTQIIQSLRIIVACSRNSLVAATLAVQHN